MSVYENPTTWVGPLGIRDCRVPLVFLPPVDRLDLVRLEHGQLLYKQEVTGSFSVGSILENW